jgi:hypothetical protein
MKKRDRKKWRGWYVCDEKGGIEEEKERRGTGGFAWMPREKGKKKEKEERKEKGKRERERERGGHLSHCGWLGEDYVISS